VTISVTHALNLRKHESRAQTRCPWLRPLRHGKPAYRRYENGKLERIMERTSASACCAAAALTEN
jgi:hypothetical protein